MTDAAGREMDEAVAREVMGWRTIGPDDPIRLERERGGYVYDGSAFRFPDVPPQGIIADRWSPSTDIAAAMSIVTLRDLFSLERSQRTNGVFFWKSDLNIGAVEGKWGEGEADTAPLAICKAAIACVRGRGGESKP